MIRNQGYFERISCRVSAIFLSKVIALRGFGHSSPSCTMTFLFFTLNTFKYSYTSSQVLHVVFHYRTQGSILYNIHTVTWPCIPWFLSRNYSVDVAIWLTAGWFETVWDRVVFFLSHAVTMVMVSRLSTDTTCPYVYDKNSWSYVSS